MHGRKVCPTESNGKEERVKLIVRGAKPAGRKHRYAAHVVDTLTKQSFTRHFRSMSQERYPRSVWTRFRQLMRLPRAQRHRRDMAVCAILLGVREARGRDIQRGREGERVKFKDAAWHRLVAKQGGGEGSSYGVGGKRRG